MKPLKTSYELPLSKTRPAEGDNPAVRTQLALIRSITDELARLQARDPIACALEAQLQDEMARLDRIMEQQPRSGAHVISLRDAG